MDESQILIGLQKEDKGAWDLLFDLMYPKLRFYLLKVLKNEKDAEDIAIQSLVKFWQHGASNFESFNQVRKFLFTVGRNAAFDLIEKNKNILKRYKGYVYLSPEAEDELEDRTYYKLEMFQYMLEKNIEKLPNKTKEVFKMVYFDKKSRLEVAKILNTVPHTIDVHCSNAIRKLRELFLKNLLLISI